MLQTVLLMEFGHDDFREHVAEERIEMIFPTGLQRAVVQAVYNKNRTQSGGNRQNQMPVATATDPIVEEREEGEYEEEQAAEGSDVEQHSRSIRRNMQSISAHCP